MKNRFTIGEISALFNLNVQTLHYYESIGLFLPASKNKNGYRLYQFDQIYQLASIRYLKKLGYSLIQIKEHMDSRDIDYTLDRLKTQSEEIKKQWHELMTIDKVIQRKISFTEKQLRNMDIGSIGKKLFPRRYYMPIGAEELLYRSDHFYFYPTIVFYRGTEKRFGAMLTDVTEEERILLNPEVIKPGEFLCCFHTGPYETIKTAFNRILEWARKENMDLSEESLNTNIIDQFIERDSEKYITEVQFRIISSTEKALS